MRGVSITLFIKWPIPSAGVHPCIECLLLLEGESFIVPAPPRMTHPYTHMMCISHTYILNDCCRYDAGDLNRFTFPAAFTVATLALGFLQFENAFDQVCNRCTQCSVNSQASRTLRGISRIASKHNGIWAVFLQGLWTATSALLSH